MIKSDLFNYFYIGDATCSDNNEGLDGVKTPRPAKHGYNNHPE